MSLWPVRRVRDPATDLWSVPIGAWFGTPVRLHVTLLVVLVLATGAAVQAASFDLGLAVAVFLGSLALHEAAHVFAAWRLGGVVEGIVLSPFGGLRPGRLPADPEARVFVAMAGPMANLAAVVVAVICLAGWNEPTPPALFVPQLDSSLRPLLGGDWLSAGAPVVAVAKLMIWINWPLFALNLLPAFPFDGGEAARSLLASRLGSASASEFVARGAMIVGAALLAATPLLGIGDGWPAPSAAVAALGVLVCVGAHRDRLVFQENRSGAHPLAYPSDDAGFDLAAEGFAGDDQVVLMEVGRHAGHAEPAGPHSRPADRPDDGDDEQRLDDVLAKLHTRGMDGLTADERGLLERVSDRLRRRRRP